ncbi:43442_t:CDS:2, partial [Gigaspora margarita]
RHDGISSIYIAQRFYETHPNIHANLKYISLHHGCEILDSIKRILKDIHDDYKSLAKKIYEMITFIYQKFYQSNVTCLSESDIKEIRESKGKVPNASKRMAKKFHIGAYHVYEIWEHIDHLQQDSTDKMSETKKETILSEASQKTEDPLEFYKRTQEDAKKIRAVVRADISKLSAPISKT